MFSSVFAIILGLSCCSQGQNHSLLVKPRLLGPSEGLTEDFVDFYCVLEVFPRDEPILLQLFKAGDRKDELGFYTSTNGVVGTFPKKVTKELEGDLECLATGQNSSQVQPAVSQTHHFRVIEQVSGAFVEILSIEEEFFEGKTLELQCDVAKGSHVSYSWLLNGRPVAQSPRHRATGQQLLITGTTSEDSGVYMCVATNSFNKTSIFNSSSTEVVITVKDVVSKPNISYTVVKKTSNMYSAVITCQSLKGTPPITFSFYNQTEEIFTTTVDDREERFEVAVILNSLGWFHCEADNGNGTVYSDWIPIEVVRVEGPVMMHYDTDVGENYAVIGLRLYCRAAKGTHPRYRWFLNETLLNDEGSFYYVSHQPPEQSILQLSVGPDMAGTYHCEVSDSFDDTAAFSSRAQYLDQEVLNRTPVLTTAIVFGSLICLVLLMAVSCWFGVKHRRQEYGNKSLVSMEMAGSIPAYEGDLDVLEFYEDMDVVRAAREEEFDQASHASSDEWYEILRTKRTLEDDAEHSDYL